MNDPGVTVTPNTLLPPGEPDEFAVTTPASGVRYEISRWGARVVLRADDVVIVDRMYPSAVAAAAWYANDWMDDDACAPREGDLLQIKATGELLRVEKAVDCGDAWEVSGWTACCGQTPRESTWRLRPAEFLWLTRAVAR